MPGKSYLLTIIPLHYVTAGEALKNSRLVHCLICILLLLFFSSIAFALSDEEVLSLQNKLKGKSIGERIACFAEQFVGTPYDTDPLGTYVTQSVIVADEKVDCMYLTFRTVELALSSTPDEAVQTALERRFHSRGIVSNGKVINYDDRFAYGEDMIYSGKWGKEITAEIGRTVMIQGPRSGQGIIMLRPREALKGEGKLKNGDLLFFIKNPSMATSHEIVGHIGTIRIYDSKTGDPDSSIYLIHASGRKGKGGIVKKIVLADYLKRMPFIGVKITRFP